MVQEKDRGVMLPLLPARAYTDWNLVIKGIGVSEKTAVAIDEKNIATVFGKGDAYFLMPISKNGPPEQCETGK